LLREIQCSDDDEYNDNVLLRCDVILSGRYLLTFRRRLLLLLLPVFDYAISLWRENLVQNNFYLHFSSHELCKIFAQWGSCSYYSICKFQRNILLDIYAARLQKNFPSSHISKSQVKGLKPNMRL